MSYSVDVNIFLYASDSSSRFHSLAREFVESCARHPEPFFLTHVTVMSYLRMATHPRIFTEPLTPSVALANVESLCALPHARVVSERQGFLALYREITEHDNIRANLVPDAHLAALLKQHGVSKLFTNNPRDFAPFDFLDVRNPLL